MKKDHNVDKRRVARSFFRGRNTYDRHATIQNKVSGKLIQKLSEYPDIQFGNVLEIGCCTGTLTEMLLSDFPVKRLYLNDLVPSFHGEVSARQGVASADTEIIPFFGDIEELRLPENLDLILSSSTFQWLADLETFLAQTASALKAGGYLCFSIFGPGTLAEFKELTGIGLRYASVGYILDLLENHFVIEEEETVKDQLFFDSSREVLRHFQATGVGGVRNYRWTPARLRRFEEEYSEKYGGASGVPVTYMSSYIIATKRK